MEISAQSLSAVGSREDAEFAGCWALAHEVDETQAEAKYENGLLQVRIPLKKPVEGTKVKIK